MKKAFDVFIQLIALIVFGGMAYVLIQGISHPDPKVRDAANTAILLMP